MSKRSFENSTQENSNYNRSKICVHLDYIYSNEDDFVTKKVVEWSREVFQHNKNSFKNLKKFQIDNITRDWEEIAPVQNNVNTSNSNNKKKDKNHSNNRFKDIFNNNLTIEIENKLNDDEIVFYATGKFNKNIEELPEEKRKISDDLFKYYCILFNVHKTEKILINEENLIPNCELSRGTIKKFVIFKHLAFDVIQKFNIHVVNIYRMLIINYRIMKGSNTVIDETIGFSERTFTRWMEKLKKNPNDIDNKIHYSQTLCKQKFIHTMYRIYIENFIKTIGKNIDNFFEQIFIRCIEIHKDEAFFFYYYYKYFKKNFIQIFAQNGFNLRLTQWSTLPRTEVCGSILTYLNAAAAANYMKGFNPSLVVNFDTVNISIDQEKEKVIVSSNILTQYLFEQLVTYSDKVNEITKEKEDVEDIEDIEDVENVEDVEDVENLEDEEVTDIKKSIEEIIKRHEEGASLSLFEGIKLDKDELINLREGINGFIQKHKHLKPIGKNKSHYANVKVVFTYFGDDTFGKVFYIINVSSKDIISKKNDTINKLFPGNTNELNKKLNEFISKREDKKHYFFKTSNISPSKEVILVLNFMSNNSLIYSDIMKIIARDLINRRTKMSNLGKIFVS